MNSRWCRIGNFYTDNQKISGSSANNVTYRNLTANPTIKEFCFNFYQDKVQLHIGLSPFHEAYLLTISERFFSKDEISNYPGCLETLLIWITSPLLLKNINNYLEYLNKNGKNEFTSDIICEIAGIFARIFPDDAVLKPFLLQQHKVPELIMPHSYTHPEKQSSRDLVNYLWQPTSTVSITKVKQQLKEGEDPNQSGITGRRPLHRAAAHHISITELLLGYRADPFLVNEDSMNALDVAMKWNRIDILNCIINAFTHPEKPIIKIKKIHLAGDAKEHHSLFQFTDENWISTRIKKTESLTCTELNSIFDLFYKYFESKNSTELKNEFEDEISGKNKFLEMITHKNKLIGFNLIEVIKPKHYDDYIVIHTIYSLIEPEFRGYSLMSLLIFRLPFAWQIANLNRQVFEYFCALHYNSYRMIQDTLHFPRHQPKNIFLFLASILEKIYDTTPPLQIQNDAIYLEENLWVKGSQLTKPPTDIRQHFFYQHLCGQSTKFDPKPRSVPVLFLADAKNREIFEYSVRSLGVKFTSHVTKFSRSIRPLICDKEHGATEITRPRVADKFSFWYIRERSSSVKSISNQNRLRAKL